jgi:hypothetical protein
MIIGSNALGEAIPSHFWFQTSAKLEDTQQVQMEMGIYFKPIWCRFGMPERTLCGISIELNEKGGWIMLSLKSM